MARDTGPQCKQCRREGQKLFLKGERCLTDKCGVERRSIAHFSVRQRSPFKKSLSPSRRHWRHFAPVSRATTRASASWAARRCAPAGRRP